MNIINQPKALERAALVPSRPERVLSQNDLSRWSADEFALAIALARRPARFMSGMNAQPVSLQPLMKSQLEPVLAHVPLETKDGACTLHLTAEALDTLAALLTPEVDDPRGLGRSLSLDALEAILVALLSPVDGLTVGRAAWMDDPAHGASAALSFASIAMPIWGASGALVALYRLIAAAGMASPDLLAGTVAERLAQAEAIGVQAERLFGTVELSPQDRVALEVGGGIMLDTYWPNGTVALGRRFSKVGNGWRMLPDLRKSKALVLRSHHAIQALSDPELGYLPESTRQLDLLDGHTVIATGRLVPAVVNDSEALVLRIDELR